MGIGDALFFAGGLLLGFLLLVGIGVFWVLKIEPNTRPVWFQSQLVGSGSVLVDLTVFYVLLLVFERPWPEAFVAAEICGWSVRAWIAVRDRRAQKAAGIDPDNPATPES
jgi:hypothetical protein